MISLNTAASMSTLASTSCRRNQQHSRHHPTGDELLIGSNGVCGLWLGLHCGVRPPRPNPLPGEIVAIATSAGSMERFGVRCGFARPLCQPATDGPRGQRFGRRRHARRWEVVHGLDPTDPWDALFDNDADGLDLDQSGDMNLERLWTNLDEYRYVKLTPEGYNATDPRIGDTDGDGVGDGSEYYGFFYEQSTLWCYCTYKWVHLRQRQGQAANAIPLAGQHRHGDGPDQPRLGRRRHARRLGNSASSMGWRYLHRWEQLEP